MGLEGQGVGFDTDRNIYFVPGSVTGDRVLVETTQVGRRYRDSQLVEVISPSPFRQTPICAHFPSCGGCDWLHMEYSEQLRSKEASLTHILDRAGLSPTSRLPIVPSPRQLGYRNRVQLHFEGGRIGFHRRGSTVVIAIEKCAVACESINQELARLRSSLQIRLEHKKVELISDEKGEVTGIFDSPQGGAGFTQVNREQNDALRDTLRMRVEEARAEKVLELYCGDGNLTSVYFERVQQVVGIDNNHLAIEKAVRRIPSERSHFIVDAIGVQTPKKLPRGFSYDTLILDPPRSGIGKALESFLHDNLKNIIYVSCSPLSFSMDTKRLAERGFALNSLQPIDMFPHTHHLEIVAYFSRVF